jgi:uncharacterized protein Yka (UPF0111/DUF47 family)
MKRNLRWRREIGAPRECADKFVRVIVDTYLLPNKTIPELRAMMESSALDPLREFSEMCREELSALVKGNFSKRKAR